MATITMPTGAEFIIAEVSIFRSISRQGKGARAAWRAYKLPESQEVLGWNERRAAWPSGRLPGIRGLYREFHRWAKDQPDPWATID